MPALIAHQWSPADCARPQLQAGGGGLLGLFLEGGCGQSNRLSREARQHRPQVVKINVLEQRGRIHRSEDAHERRFPTLLVTLRLSDGGANGPAKAGVFRRPQHARVDTT